MREAGLEVKDVSDYTGFPEMMDGRVKTLHPKVHGGLLHLRDNAEHGRPAAWHSADRSGGGEPISIRETVAKPDVTLEDAIENIDIGGPSMLRSAAKNHESVTVITDPADYAAVAGRSKPKVTRRSTCGARWSLGVRAYGRLRRRHCRALMQAFGAEEAGTPTRCRRNCSYNHP